MIVYLNCNGAVSDAYELARMGVRHVYCGMNRDSVAWALDPIPVSESVDKWVLLVRERPFAHREMHLIVFDGDAVGIVFNDNDSQKPRE
jgi:hypothetical protein